MIPFALFKSYFCWGHLRNLCKNCYYSIFEQTNTNEQFVIVRVTNRLFWKPVNRLTVAIFQLTETGYFSRYYRLIWLKFSRKNHQKSPFLRDFQLLANKNRTIFFLKLDQEHILKLNFPCKCQKASKNKKLAFFSTKLLLENSKVAENYLQMA